MTLDVVHLLGAPYEHGGHGRPGFDCRTLAFHILTQSAPRGLGWDVPASTLWSTDDPRDIGKTAEELIEENAEAWMELAPTDEHDLGDVLELRGLSEGYQGHLAICVQTKGWDGQYATATEAHGVIVRPIERFGGVRRRFRLRQEFRAP